MKPIHAIVFNKAHFYLNVQLEFYLFSLTQTSRSSSISSVFTSLSRLDEGKKKEKDNKEKWVIKAAESTCQPELKSLED